MQLFNIWKLAIRFSHLSRHSLSPLAWKAAVGSGCRYNILNIFLHFGYTQGSQGVQPIEGIISSAAILSSVNEVLVIA